MIVGTDGTSSECPSLSLTLSLFPSLPLQSVSKTNYVKENNFFCVNDFTIEFLKIPKRK